MLGGSHQQTGVTLDNLHESMRRLHSQIRMVLSRSIKYLLIAKNAPNHSLISNNFGIINNYHSHKWF